MNLIKYFQAVILLFPLTLISCKFDFGSSKKTSGSSKLSNIRFGDLKNSDGTMIEFSNLKIKVYGSETSETPIKEVDYEYTGSSIQDENLSVERGKSYFLYLEYYAKESMLNDNKPADENIVEETPSEETPSEDKPAEEKPSEDKPAEEKAEDTTNPKEDNGAEDKLVILYENCDKKRTRFEADKETINVRIELCKPNTAKTSDDNVITTSAEDDELNSIPEKTKRGDTVTKLTTKDRTYWTAGHVPVVQGEDLGKIKQVVDALGCAHLCDLNEQCNAFSHNAKEEYQSCYLKKLKFADTGNYLQDAEERGWKFYWSQSLKEGNPIDFR